MAYIQWKWFEQFQRTYVTADCQIYCYPKLVSVKRVGNVYDACRSTCTILGEESCLGHCEH